jgi:hypothetical protein
MKHDGDSPDLPLLGPGLGPLLHDHAIRQDRGNPAFVQTDIGPHKKWIVSFGNPVFHDCGALPVITGYPDEPELVDLDLLKR